jgi:ABC-2 type transport system ATP-binding protein
MTGVVEAVGTSRATQVPAIRATALRKEYRTSRGQVTAVHTVSFDVRQGEVFGLLGPNGAGKTTTVGMLTTRVRPTGGAAHIMELDVARHPDAVKRRIGVVTQYNTLDRQLTVAENLEFRGRFAGLTARAARRRAGELLELFELTDRANAMVFQMSGGQAQRVMIARALVPSPDVLFLDEPTSGLDPSTRFNLWEIIRQMRAQGQTVLLTTHYMEEAEALADRIAILDHGRVLACDTLPGLIKATGAATVLIIGVDAEAEPTGVARMSGTARDLPGVERVEADAQQLRVFTPHPERVLPDLIRASHDAGLTLRDIQVRRPSLETIFLSLTGQEYRE